MAESLDQVLLRAARDVAIHGSGTPAPDRIRDAVALLLQVAPDRPATWFAAGACLAFGFGSEGWPPARPPLGTCLEWWCLGQLSAVLEGLPARLLVVLRERPKDVARALRTPEGAALLDVVVAKGLATGVDDLIIMLSHAELTGEECVRVAGALQDWGERLLDAGDATRVHDVCARFLHDTTAHGSAGELPRAEGCGGAHSRLRLLMSRCDRAQGRFAEAAEHVQDRGAPGEGLLRAEWRLEERLVDARIRTASDILPVRSGLADRVNARLEAMEHPLKAVADRHQDHPEAQYLLACLELARGQEAAAAVRFGHVREAVGHCPVVGSGSAVLADRSDHWSSLLGILSLDEIECARYAEVFARTLAHHKPAPDDLRDALDALAAAKSGGLCDVVRAVADAGIAPVLAAEAVAEAMRQDPGLIERAPVLADAIPKGDRLAFLGSALSLAGALARDCVVDSLLDAADDEMTGSGGWHAWAHILMASSDVRAALDRDGAWVDTCILDALLRGGLEGAIQPYMDVLTRLAVRPSRAVDLSPYFEEALGYADTEHLEGLRAAWESAWLSHGPPTQHEGPRRQTPVRVCFIGGDAQERRELDQAKRRLRDDGHGWIEVTGVHPGWSSNWPVKADQAEALFPNSDVVVLMPRVRTNFGRRIRRSVDDYGLAWFACTGQGAGSMAAAILRAARWRAARPA